MQTRELEIIIHGRNKFSSGEMKKEELLEYTWKLIDTLGDLQRLERCSGHEYTTRVLGSGLQGALGSMILL